MAGNDKLWTRGKLMHAILRTQVGFHVERLGNGDALFEVLVKVGIIAGQHHYAGRRCDAEKLRLPSMLSANIGGDAWHDLLAVAVDQIDSAQCVELHQTE